MDEDFSEDQQMYAVRLCFYMDHFDKNRIRNIKEMHVHMEVSSILGRRLSDFIISILR